MKSKAQDIVLVIDDDPIARTTLEVGLRLSGYDRFVFAEDGYQAFDALQDHGDEIALITCDLFMPGVDGIDLIAYFAQRRVTYPIIVVSSAPPSIVNATCGKATDAGLNLLGSITKPVNPHLLSSLTATARPKSDRHRLGSSQTTSLLKRRMSKVQPAF